VQRPLTVHRRAGIQCGLDDRWTPDQQRTTEPVLGPRETRTRVQGGALRSIRGTETDSPGLIFLDHRIAPTPAAGAGVIRPGATGYLGGRET